MIIIMMSSKNAFCKSRCVYQFKIFRKVKKLNSYNAQPPLRRITYLKLIKYKNKSLSY